jgi:hypothetical protein
MTISPKSRAMVDVSIASQARDGQPTGRDDGNRAEQRDAAAIEGETGKFPEEHPGVDDAKTGRRRDPT